jgi:hypothetical protein
MIRMGNGRRARGGFFVRSLLGLSNIGERAAMPATRNRQRWQGLLPAALLNGICRPPLGEGRACANTSPQSSNGTQRRQKSPA